MVLKRNAGHVLPSIRQCIVLASRRWPVWSSVYQSELLSRWSQSTFAFVTLKKKTTLCICRRCFYSHFSVSFLVSYIVWCIFYEIIKYSLARNHTFIFVLMWSSWSHTFILILRVIWFHNIFFNFVRPAILDCLSFCQCALKKIVHA